MTIEEQVRRYIAESFLFSDDGYPLPDDASFMEEGIVNSMGVLELIMFAEERFGIAVADRDVVPENFDSVTRLATYIRSKMAAFGGELREAGDAGPGLFAVGG